MSDSDDTDILLLIPPDFFNVHSDNETEYRLPGNVVSNLIHQVNDLSSRLSYIENESVKSDMSETEKRFTSPTKRLDIHDVDKLLKEMETTQAEIESKLRQREIDFEKNKAKRLSQLGDNIGSVPDLGLGIRKLFQDDDPNEIVEPPCIKKNFIPLGEDVTKWKNVLATDNSPSKLSSSLSPDKRRFKQRRRLNLSQDGVSTTSSLEHDLAFRKKEDSLGGGDIPTLETTRQFGTQKLLSLNSLWKEDHQDSVARLKQKLEEEQYRRKHLEETIQSLQRKLLDEEEKVAVAVKVDETKDKAIGQLTTAWKQMVDHWKKIEEHRHEATQQLLQEKELTKKAQLEMDKKIERWEREVSQALDLAADYKSKCESLESELFTVQETLSIKIADYDEMSTRAGSQIQVLEEDRKSIIDKLTNTQKELEKERKEHQECQKKLEELESSLNSVETGKTIVQEQRDTLTLRLQEEKSRVSVLESQNRALKEALDGAIKKREEAEREATTTSGQLDAVKKEVRAAYQSQLETVVREKLNEFQSQLDSAQVSMQAELEAQSKKHQEKFLHQKQALISNHIAEMRRLEAAHKDELHSLELKLAEFQRRCTRLESGKKEIAQKLHGVMEQQWQQALSIITSELTTKKPEPERMTRQDKEALFKQWSEESERRIGSGRLQQEDHPLSGVAPISRVTSVSEDVPFNREGLLTSRSNTAQQDQLLKYIQMLLERRPGHPVDSTLQSGLMDLTIGSDFLEEPHSDDGTKWSEAIQKTNKESQEGKSSKQPWK